MTNDKGSKMAQKKTPYLKLVKPPDDVKEIKKKTRKINRKKAEKVLSILILVILAICGTWLLMKNQTYGQARKGSGYTKELSDTNSFARFANGIVRYNRDGVVFLNRKNEEQWIQPTQLQNPIIEVRENAFAVADSGGNNILVFDRDGLKGEIETTLPIEKIAISDQGIVSAILRNEGAPKIISYDATGNILVEQQSSLNSTGYPVALDMSDDGNTLAVSYLYTQGTAVQSRVIYYNFGETGQSKTDNVVASDEYDGTVMAEVFFMGSDRSVIVGDASFVIYSGRENPKQMKEVKLTQEIKSVFHSDKYIGFILLNQEKSGYEVCLYDRSGERIFTREITGDYGNVRMDGDEIIMFEGSRCCIITVTGIIKFQGDLMVDVLEMFRAPGVNRYYVMTVNELRIVYLTK